MRVQSLKGSQRALLRGAALILVGSLAAGCSSGVSRFTDGMFTGATANQRQMLRKDNQPYPGDVARPSAANGAYNSSAARAAVEPAPISQPVKRTVLAPVEATPKALPPPAQPAPRVAKAEPVKPAVDPAPTGTIKPAPLKAEAPQPKAASVPPSATSDGWVAEGGRLVTLKDGESLGTISDRYGVPVKAIVNVNGFADANSVRAGQRVIVPVYVYARDKSEKPKPVAAAPAEKTPAPKQEPANNVAVLPKQPRLKEKEPQPEAARNDTKTASADRGVYIVESGDSLYSIAKKNGVTTDAMRRANGLDRSSTLKIGQKLRVPSADVAAAPKLDSTATGSTPASKPAKAAAAEKPVAKAEKPAVQPDKPVAKAEKPAEEKPLAVYTPPKRDGKEIKAAAASSDDDAPDSTGIGKMRWPVRGRVISNYGSNGEGIDIAVPEGTAVKAAENGVVIFAGDGLKDFGKTVLVRHADGKVTVYGHTSEITVKRGDTIRRGQEIARSGMTGNADTPKLHFEVRENSDPVDPQKYLE
jgi:murein DD-endopeptidase MepM/ murein hydrolase activator NlpD